MTDLDELIAKLHNLANLEEFDDDALAELLSEAADALNSVRAERDDLEERLSGYLCDSTGGRLSKTGYDVRTMVTHTEEYYGEVHAEAREDIEAERDAALARVAELEKLLENYTREYPIECNKRVKAEARIAELEAENAEAWRVAAEQTRLERGRAEQHEARIAEAAKLHRPFEWSFGYGPVKSCRGCADRGVPQEKAEWPCPTAVALGLNEGENE